MAVMGMWSGTVSFGLVAIPVRLVKAVDTGRVTFRMLHGKDYSPLERKMFCPKDERIVSPDEIVRGYEIGPETYIAVTEDELESLAPERSRTIEITEFLETKDLDPLYYDHPYYLVPSKGGEKAYTLLVEVMRLTGKAGIARFVLADREYLVAIRSVGDALCLTTLHYPHDVLSPDMAGPEESRIDGAVKEGIKASIGKMKAPFQPEKYANERRRKVLDLLKKKIEEQAPVEAPAIEEEEGRGPADLLAALEESMRKVKEQR